MSAHGEVTIFRGDARATIVSAGGGLREYVAGDGPVLDGYEAGEQCDGGRGQILAPWPNRLADGRYGWAGQTHEAPITERETATANHGLVRHALWRLVQLTDDTARAAYVLEPSDAYPSRIALTVEYALLDSGLSVRTTVRNLGTSPAPFGLGFHPYLTTGAANIDADSLTLDATEMEVLDERGLPTGRRRDVTATQWDLRTGAPIGQRVLDACYIALGRESDGIARATLRSADGSIARTLWMDGSFAYVMVFTGDTLAPNRRRRGVAIEPMTCPPNALATGDGVIALEPGGTQRFHWGIAPTG